ncbi:MAG TPA: ABC transporter ATP-binding protein [Deltaproteobacteria bacterium]|nr:ABC transporter ATP-binding protein [Deltaproteobacteria bacterium]
MRTRATSALGQGPAAQTPAVLVRDLTKRFPAAVALGGVSFEVRRGEILGLLGPNGAGKTTTLHVLLGLVRPTAGSVRIFGLDPHRERAAALRRVGFASPEALMDWRLGVEENLRVYAEFYGAERASVARALAVLELESEARTKFGELSLGQQMRAGLARALLHSPELLVLDEPTASLDPDISDKTRRLLLSLRKERGLSILYTSHDMAEVEALCDRVVFLHHGRVVAEGTPLAVSRRVLSRADLDAASLEEVFLKISREGGA